MYEFYLSSPLYPGLMMFKMVPTVIFPLPFGNGNASLSFFKPGHVQYFVLKKKKKKCINTYKSGILSKKKHSFRAKVNKHLKTSYLYFTIFSKEIKLKTLNQERSV